MAIKSNAISVGGKTRKVQKGSEAEKKYLSQGGTILKGAEGKAGKASRSAELKAFNHPGSPTYIDQDAIPDGPAEGQAPTTDLATPAAPAPVQAPTAPKPTFDLSKAFTGGLVPKYGQTNAPVTPPTPVQNKYQAGLAQAQASGTPPPAAGGTLAAQPFIQKDPAPTIADDMFANDEDGFFQGLQTELQDYFNPKTQRESLTKEYQKMVKQSGIEALDLELIDMKNIIEGTEDDIRNEVASAGGFATDSQVLALTNSRNKQLIKNYNTLLETRNSKEQYLDKMMDLSVKDREIADAQFDRMMNIGFKALDYRDKMKTNAQNSYQKIVDTVGYDGLYQAAIASGDPLAVERINKTFGAGFNLQGLAAQPNLERQLLQERIKTEQAQRSNIYSQISERDGKTTPTAFNSAMAESEIKTGDDVLANKYLEGAVGPSKIARFTLTGDITGGKKNFIGDVENMISGLTLDNLVRAKAEGATFGALSEGELKLLANSASKISNAREFALDEDGKKTTNVIGYGLNEVDFKNEIQRINNFKKLDAVISGVDPSSFGGAITSDGKLAIPNWDGSVDVYKLP